MGAKLYADNTLSDAAQRNPSAIVVIVANLSRLWCFAGVTDWHAKACSDAAGVLTYDMHRIRLRERVGGLRWFGW